MTLDHYSGVITGQPVNGGTYTFRLECVLGPHQTIDINGSLNVQPAIVTPTPTSTPSGVLSGCQLDLLPNPEVVQQGGSEAILVKTNPGQQVGLEVFSGGSGWPGWSVPVWVTGATQAAGEPVPATGGVAAHWLYSVQTGPNGRALFDLPVPASQVIGSYQLSATASGPGSFMGRCSCESSCARVLHSGWERPVGPGIG